MVTSMTASCVNVYKAILMFNYEVDTNKLEVKVERLVLIKKCLRPIAAAFSTAFAFSRLATLIKGKKKLLEMYLIHFV